MWIQHIRIGNLFAITLILVLLYYRLVSGSEANNFWLMLILHVGTVVSIAAGGYLLNDHYDRKADRINKNRSMSIAPEKAKIWWLTTSGMGLVCSVLLGLTVSSWSLLAIAILSFTLLFMYSYWLQRLSVIGNLTVSFLCTLVAISVPLVTTKLGSSWLSSNSPFAVDFRAYAAFAFFITLARELIKDLEDKSGDAASGHRTLAVYHEGAARAAACASLITISLLILAYLLNGRNSLSAVGTVWSSVLMVIGLLIGFRVFFSREKRAYSMLSTWCKMYMVMGIVLPIFWHSN